MQVVRIEQIGVALALFSNHAVRGGACTPQWWCAGALLVRSSIPEILAIFLGGDQQIWVGEPLHSIVSRLESG